jgi:hypothetical protein
VIRKNSEIYEIPCAFGLCCVCGSEPKLGTVDNISEVERQSINILYCVIIFGDISEVF